MGRPAGDVKPSGLIIIDATNSGVSQDLENKLTEYTRPGGYAAILVRDVRNGDGTITPLGLEVERRLANNPYLKIKELIVVSIEDDPTVTALSRDLNITHCYVLVYIRAPGKK